MVTSIQSAYCYRCIYFVGLFLMLSCPSIAVLSENQLRDAVPAPIVVQPSQDWDGNDGPWSSFALQIGTPPQNVKVFPSTAGVQTWVVAEEGCTSLDPPNCFDLRGRLYNYNTSSTWKPNLSNLTSDIYPLGLESSLGYNGNGRYGFDNISLGWQGSGGPSLKNQTMAGIAAKDFYLGIFGLTARPSNFTTYNDPIPSFMENLRSENLIPSTSWAYTAGNQYRLNHILGSLILGGYDNSKFIPNNLTTSFSEENNRELVIQVQNIVTGATPKSLLPTPIPAFIDSTVPYIWLPESACALFESAFGLVWNDTAELYLLNTTQQTALQAQNASITFSIGNLTSSETVDITFPYSAFELTAAYPLVDNDTKYFPIKRADNETQYTLGRTFFQEAYVVADYERRKFSISACKYDPLESQNIVAILPPSNTTNPTSASSRNHHSSTSISKAATSGIAAGGALFAIAVAALVVFWARRKKRSKAAERAANNAKYQEMILKPELDGTVKAPEIYETEGRKYVPPAVMKVGEAEIEPVYEMAAEEVGVELMSASRVEIGSKGGTPGPSPIPTPSPSPRNMRVLRKKRSVDEFLGVGRGDLGSETQRTVSPDMTPRSLATTPVISTASEGERKYVPYRQPNL